MPFVCFLALMLANILLFPVFGTKDKAKQQENDKNDSKCSASKNDKQCFTKVRILMKS